MGNWWEQAFTAFKDDFSDLGDATWFARLVLRLSLAAILGGILGLEREHAGKSAGARTHMLVALGAAVSTFVAQQSGMTSEGISRVVQGIVAGIGFLGAGAILKSSEEGQIKGLTTAAGIWLTAAIGLAAGLGREATALVSTFFAWLVLAAIPALHAAYNRRRRR